MSRVFDRFSKKSEKIGSNIVKFWKKYASEGLTFLWCCYGFFQFSAFLIYTVKRSTFFDFTKKKSFAESFHF